MQTPGASPVSDSAVYFRILKFGEESQRHWKFSGVGCVGLAVRLEYSHMCSCTMTVYHDRRCDLSDESTEFLEPRRRYSMAFKRPALLVQFQSNSSKGSEGSKGSKCSNRLETKAMTNDGV